MSGCCDVDKNPDYCTIHRAMGGRYVAAHMRYDAASDEWRIRQSWGPVSKVEAERIAREWARKGRLEYRP